MSIKSILVVDDDEDVREIIQLLLASYGYEVRTAGSGYEAIEQLRTQPLPSLVLLDLRMPGMNGEQFMGIVRGALTDERLRVVLMSGDGEAWRLARSLDADGFLQKPVELEHLVDTVARLSSASPPGHPMQFPPTPDAVP